MRREVVKEVGKGQNAYSRQMKCGTDEDEEAAKLICELAIRHHERKSTWRSFTIW